VNKIPLEFEGSISLPETFAPGYDCRICLVLHGVEADGYRFLTKKDERLDDKGREIDWYKILPGEMTICLPDHHYAHADHDLPNKTFYAEMLEARLPKSECERLSVREWLTKG